MTPEDADLAQEAILKLWLMRRSRAVGQRKGDRQPDPTLRGFAAMNPTRQRSLQRLGGFTVQAHGTGHRWTAAEASRAGQRARKGGNGGR